MLDQPVPARASHARDLIIGGATAVIPALWRHEISNAIVMAERRGRLTPSQVVTLAADVERFLQIIEIDPLVVPVPVLVETAQRTHLTVYDATYFELASRRRLPLATLDDRLREAAQRNGLAVV
jgi:predicted nucleic acid-binding protein